MYNLVIYVCVYYVLHYPIIIYQAGQSVIGLQYGSNKGASQAGMTPYGASRQIRPEGISYLCKNNHKVEMFSINSFLNSIYPPLINRLNFYFTFFIILSNVEF